MRCFAALDLSQEVLDEIKDFIQRLRSDADGIRWTTPPQWHLTLKFLGSVDLGILDALREALRAVAKKTVPFSIRLEGLGVFPEPREPRVIWLGLGEGASEVAGLAGRIEKGIAQLGFKPEARSYTPHLTLGRVKSIRIHPSVAHRLQKESFSSIHCIRMDHFTLYQSTLLPEGARYEVLDSFPFASDAPYA